MKEEMEHENGNVRTSQQIEIIDPKWLQKTGNDLPPVDYIDVKG